MSMSLHDAANALLSQISAPNGAVNILPLHDGGEDRLVVWLDPSYANRALSIPASFEGFTVTVELRRTARAFH